VANWSVSDIPPQHGRSTVITGTGGLGFETALTRAGGAVILAGRDADKGAASLARIRAVVPSADIVFEPLDLARLASVAAFAERMVGQRERVDVLVNNAGVMRPTTRMATADGFELQFGTNYLGHFALTALLLPLLRHGRDARVVSVSSIAHRNGAIHFDDLQWERRYRAWPAYSQSKLAMLMFALELQRRSDAAGWGLMSNAAHPGYARTDLIANGPGGGGLFVAMTRLIQPFLSQSAADGALPLVFAATSSDAVGGGYYGPHGFQELKGPVASARIMPQALDEAAASRLWDASVRLTGASFG
jgi:NAD(P)-dependent dehydrogenase (short-subunit alcohol dehydrogenase family)